MKLEAIYKNKIISILVVILYHENMFQKSSPMSLKRCAHPTEAHVQPAVVCYSNAILLMQGMCGWPSSMQHTSPCSSVAPASSNWHKSGRSKRRTSTKLTEHLFLGQLLSMCPYLSYSTSPRRFSCLVGLLHWSLPSGLQFWIPFYMFRAWLRPLGTAVLLRLMLPADEERIDEYVLL